MRYPLGPTRRPLFLLRKSRLAPARRFPPQREKHMTPDLQSHPQLVPGVRLSENKQQRGGRSPERALRLNGPSLKIAQRCSGKQTVHEISTDRQQIYPKWDAYKAATHIR